MKTINETFEDKEYELLLKAKKDLTWREFILQLIKKEVKKNEIIQKEKGAGLD